MAVTIKQLLDRVSDVLQSTEEDETDRAFAMSDLVAYYNREAHNLVAELPDANPVNKAVKLAAGIDQYIPSDGIALLAVHYNMGTGGATPGMPVMKCELAEMQASDRSWNTATATTTIYNFMPDPADPRHFWNYPPSDGTGWVFEEYSAEPDTITWDEDGNWETAVVQVADKYISKLEKMIIARAYKRDTDIPGNLVRENDNQQEAAIGS